MAKKTNFEEQLLNVEQKALDFLKSAVKEGKHIRLYTEEEAEENDNIVYEMPNVTYVSKHGMFDEYAVVGLKNKTGEIVIELKGKGEESGTEKEMPLSDLGQGFYSIDGYNLCKLADEISKLLK